MPASTTRRAEVTLPADVASASEARRFVTRTLGDWDLEHLVEDAVLLTSELVTNALLHARTEMRIVLRADAGELRAEVQDGSLVPVRIRNFSVESGTGRGLRLVGRMADAWGVEPGADGKSVWFTLPLAGRSETTFDGFDFDAVEAL